MAMALQKSWDSIKIDEMTHWEHSEEQRDEEDDKLMSCWAASCNQVELFWRSDADRPVQQTITHY